MKRLLLIPVTLSLALSGCDNSSVEVGPDKGRSGEGETSSTSRTNEVQRGMTAESLDTPSTVKEMDAAALQEREARSAELADKVPDNLPLPENVKLDTVVNNEKMAFIMAILPEAESQEVVLAFYKERLPQLGWKVGEEKPLLTGDPSLPFENDERSGIVKVYPVEGRTGFSLQIETTAK